MRNGPLLPGTARLTAIKRTRLRTLATTCMMAVHILAASSALAATQSTPKSDRLTTPGKQNANISNRAGKADRMPLARARTSVPTPANTSTAIKTNTTPGTQTPRKPASTAYAPGEIQWSRGKKSAAHPAPAPAPGKIQWSRGKQSVAPANGRTVNITAPLRDGGFFLGDLEVRVAPNDDVSVSIKQLAKIAAPILRSDALKTLQRVSAAPDGYVSLAALKNAGFDLQFDANKVVMQFTPTIEQRATGKLSVGNMRADVQSANISPPAAIAAYLNMRAGADYTTTTFYNDAGTADARIGFDGAVRWQDVVFESAATFDMMGGFTRGASRFVYDMPDETLRFSAGDISPPKSTFQGGSELLGLSIEKSYRKLQPSASIRPTGSQSFRIERPSSVEVVVNDHVVQRLQLRPGDYDMGNLPLAAGANDIELVIEDDLGHKRTLNLSLFSGGSLLAPGIAEWAFNAGFVSHINNGEKDYRNLYSGVEYDFDTPVVSGFYERGLTSDITGSIHLQADPDTVVGGSGASLQTPIGFWTMNGAVSQSQRSGSGFAGKVNYDLSNIKSSDGIRRSFRASAEYRSEKFAPINSTKLQNDTMATLSAAYSQELPWHLFGSLSGGYMLGRGAASDKYGVNLSLSRNFGRALSAGVSAGFHQTLSEDDLDTVNDGLKAAFRLTYRIDDASNLDATYDARYGQSQVSYRRQEGQGIGAWSAQADIRRIPAASKNGYGGGSGSDDSDDYAVNGALTYAADRADLAVSQRTALAGLNTDETVQRTSVTAGAALAFADGRFALGHPISSGFAIVDTHKTLPDSDISIGSTKATHAVSGLFGPALISDLSPYGPTSITYDISNLPVGYDLGNGAFDLYPSYKSGYRLTVGSDYTVAAVGWLTDNEGKSITLLTGTAYEENKPDGRKVSVFTNRNGKFSAQGLCPGRWILDMATTPSTRFVLDIPEDTVGIVKLGTLNPVEGTP